MSAVDKLQALLEKRGIECQRDHGMVTWDADGLTFSAMNAWPRNDPTGSRLVLHVTYPTPEQAVGLSLGRGTCEMVDVPDGFEDADGALWPDCWR